MWARRVKQSLRSSGINVPDVLPVGKAESARKNVKSVRSVKRVKSVKRVRSVKNLRSVKTAAGATRDMLEA